MRHQMLMTADSNLAKSLLAQSFPSPSSAFGQREGLFAGEILKQNCLTLNKALENECNSLT